MVRVQLQLRLSVYVCVCVCVCVCVRAKARKGRKEEGWWKGEERTKLRWRIYERPKQAANPRPFACISSSAFFFPFFFFPLFFLFRIPTLARVVYLALSCRRRRAVCARKKHSFIPSPLALRPSSSSSTCISYLRRLSLFKFYIVSIVVVTSRRFDYAPRSTHTALPFLPQNLRLTAITCHSRREKKLDSFIRETTHVSIIKNSITV